MLSRYGDSSSILLRIGLDGNQTRLYIDDPQYKDVYDGLLTKVATWQVGMAWNPDLVIFDDNYLTSAWNQIHRLKPCFGGSKFGADLENDRSFAHKVMRDAGLEEIESLTFSKPEQVKAHLQQHQVRHVIKPKGPKIESHHTIVSEYETGEDAIALLDRFKDKAIVAESFMVEERKMGVEVGISAWCAGSLGFVGPVNVNFEFKKVANGEVGFLTGEMGTLMRYDEDTKYNPIFNKTLKKIEATLKRHDYRGQIDLNMIASTGVDGEIHYHPLEFTPRFGKPSVFLEDELHITPWGKLCYDLATGKDPGLQVYFDWCVGVVVCGFGFPHNKAYMDASHETPVLGVKDLAHVHPVQAKMKKGQLVSSSGDGYNIVVVTGKGQGIQEAKSMAYSHLEPVKISNSFHRTDIGDKINMWDLDRLELFGKPAALEVA